MNKRCTLLMLLLSVCLYMTAQNAYLKTIADAVVSLRSKKNLDKVALKLSTKGNPRITLLDNMISRNGEYCQRGANKFRMNQVVVNVYKRQNKGMVSRGDFYNSIEKGIQYSIIEKTVERGTLVSYSIKGHIGVQEFMVITYNPKTKFTFKVNGKIATNIGNGIQYVKTDKPLTADDAITISIEYPSTNSAAFESFVFLNHNPQK